MQFRSTKRVERGGYLVYALGDEIPATDVDELVRQGHITRKDAPADLIEANAQPDPVEAVDESDPTPDVAEGAVVGVRIDDMTHDELVAAVEALEGIDGEPARWGDKRLRETLAAAREES